MKQLFIIALIILLGQSAFAQGNYTKRHLMQLSQMEFNEYDWKAQKLQKRGERLAIYGGISGLLGMGIGSLNSDDGMSTGDSNLVFGLAATMFVAGIVAVSVGIPMILVGIMRCTRVNEVRALRTSVREIQIAPLQHHCRYSNINYTGVAVSLSF